MADIAQLERALINAHKAGDARAAKMIAAEISSMKSRDFYDVDAKNASVAEKVIGGAKHGFDRMADGLADLGEGLVPDAIKDAANSSPLARTLGLTFPTQEERNRNLEAGDSFVDQAGGLAKTGQLATEIGVELLPAVKAGQVLNQATKAYAPLKRFATNLVGNAATTAGITAALSPDDKLQNAGTAGLASAAIDGALGVGGKVVRGIAPGITAEARSLMDRGVHVPFWKATSNDTLRNLSERVKGFNFAGPAMRDQEQAALADYTQMKSREAMPDYLPSYDQSGALQSWQKNPKNLQVSDTMLDDIKAQNDQVFDEIYRGKTIPMQGSGYDVPQEVDALLNEVRTTKPDIADLVEGRISGLQNPMTDATTLTSTPIVSPIVNVQGKPFITGVNQSGGNAGISADTLKDRINQATNQALELQRSGQTEAAQYMFQYADILKDMRMKGLPPEASDMLPMANQAWQNMMILENAYGRAGANRAGILSPRNMSDALRSMDRTPNKRRFAHNNMPGQRQVNQDNQVLGSVLPDVGPGTAEKMQAMMFAAMGPTASAMLGFQDLGALSLLTTKTGNRVLMGGTKPQIAATKWLNKHQPALSAVLRSGAAAGIMNQE